jgi:hypothetical protein
MCKEFRSFITDDFCVKKIRTGLLKLSKENGILLNSLRRTKKNAASQNHPYISISDYIKVNDFPAIPFVLLCGGRKICI